MAQTKQAFAASGANRWQRAGSRLTMALASGLAGTIAMPGIAAVAAQDVDCNGVNHGALNVELEATATATRQVTLKAGETLSFAFQTAAGPFGSLTLFQGTGSPRLLLLGPTGTNVSFVAANRGSFGFQFAREGADPAAFTVVCVPARRARGAGAPTVSSVPRHGAKLGTENWDYAEISEEVDPTTITLDAGAAIPQQDSRVIVSVIAPMQPGRFDMKLRDQRYTTTGVNGPEVDPFASGVDVGLNYKLLPQIMVGALAQFDQSGETRIGAPRTLSDQGWMAGPVTTVKLGPGLTLDAHAAWGFADSGADDFAARSVTMQRRTVSARLANTQSFGAWRFTPSVSVNHFQEALSASPHETVAPYQAAFGRIDVGPEIAYRIDLDKSMFIEPRAVIGSFWGIDNLSRLTPRASTHTDMRLKAEAGVIIGATDGPKLEAAGGVEEGDVTGTPNVWSGRLQLSVPIK